MRTTTSYAARVQGCVYKFSSLNERASGSARIARIAARATVAARNIHFTLKHALWNHIDSIGTEDKY